MPCNACLSTLVRQARTALCILALIVGVQISGFAQGKSYQIGCIGFYNFENLFDTLDAPDIRDEEFTPAGSKLYGTAIYTEKLDHLATVVAGIGAELTPDGPAVLGVSEIENRGVLEDFVKHPRLADRQYQIVHFDSPDRRGIDVALLYQPKYFTVEHAEALPVYLYEPDSSRIYTRDVLYVTGLFGGEPMHFFVNHWPSRSGGEKASEWKRMTAAAVCKAKIDSLTAADPKAKIILMGDLNDDPISPSVKKVLQAHGRKESVGPGELYNPMFQLFRKGFGTLAWRDTWNLFDQVSLSEGLLSSEQDGYFFHQANVYNERFLVQKTGQYKGYPFRTFVGDTYLGGYSDHFPVYVFLLRAAGK